MRPRRATAGGLAVLLALVLGGCAAPDGADGADGAIGTPAPDVTGGLEVELLLTGDDRKFARYRVERDGRLRFGGGADAMTGRFTWTGPLTPAEIERLTGEVREQGWMDADPPSTGRPPGRSYTITLWTHAGRRSFTVLGDEPGVAAVHALLDAAARRRHDAFLDGLPRAGEHR